MSCRVMRLQYSRVLLCNDTCILRASLCADIPDDPQHIGFPIGIGERVGNCPDMMNHPFRIHDTVIRRGGFPFLYLVTCAAQHGRYHPARPHLPSRGRSALRAINRRSQKQPGADVGKFPGLIDDEDYVVEGF